jgi:hypothetical protein
MIFGNKHIFIGQFYQGIMDKKGYFFNGETKSWFIFNEGKLNLSNVTSQIWKQSLRTKKIQISVSISKTEDWINLNFFCKGERNWSKLICLKVIGLEQ